MIKPQLNKGDSFMVAGCTNVMSADHRSQVMNNLDNVIKSLPCQVILTELPYIFSQPDIMNNKGKHYDDSLLSLRTNTHILLINYFLIKKHYTMSGHHFNREKKIPCGKLGRSMDTCCLISRP